MILFRNIALIVSALFPYFAFAAPPADFKELVAQILGIANLLIPVIFGLTLIVLIWGIAQTWVIGGGDPTKIEEGKKIALWGIIALVVMSGLWAIVALIKNSIF